MKDKIETLLNGKLIFTFMAISGIGKIFATSFFSGKIDSKELLPYAIVALLGIVGSGILDYLMRKSLKKSATK